MKTPFLIGPTGPTGVGATGPTGGTGGTGGAGPTGPTGAGGGTYDAVIAAMSGLVHRWKFDEASGNFADSVGSLTLTVAGTWTYRQGTAPVSSVGAAHFGASAKATTSGMGSIPVGGAARTMVAVIKSGGTAKETIWSYGTWNSTRQLYELNINDGAAGSTSLATWADDLTQASSFVSGTTFWHIIVQSYDGATTTYQWIDGEIFILGASHTLGAALNTVDSGTHFQIGLDINGGAQATGHIDDLAIFNRALDIHEVKKLMNALGY